MSGGVVGTSPEGTVCKLCKRAATETRRRLDVVCLGVTRLALCPSCVAKVGEGISGMINGLSEIFGDGEKIVVEMVYRTDRQMRGGGR